MKLNRERVVKALECCENTKYDMQCEECPLRKTMNCNHVLNRSTLSLIKELTEKIKDLEADYDRVYEQAEADIHGNMADGGTSCHWCMDKTKADTVKRMQERLKARCSCIPQHHFTYAEVAFEIDQIAKELLEGKNDV